MQASGWSGPFSELSNFILEAETGSYPQVSPEIDIQI